MSAKERGREERRSALSRLVRISYLVSHPRVSFPVVLPECSLLLGALGPRVCKKREGEKDMEGRDELLLKKKVSPLARATQPRRRGESLCFALNERTHASDISFRNDSFVTARESTFDEQRPSALVISTRARARVRKGEDPSPTHTHTYVRI